MMSSNSGPDKVLLAQQSLFRNVSFEAVENYLDNCQYRSLTAGEVLLSPDEDNFRIFLVLAGKLAVHLDSLDTLPLAYIAPGECVGEMSIIDRQSPSAFVRAASAARVLIIGGEALWAMVRASHEVARNLLDILARRMRESNIVKAGQAEMQQGVEPKPMFDALTGLYNRFGLEKMFSRVLQRCALSASPLSLFMVAVDHYKEFVAKYGYPAGDLALCAVASTLRLHLRPLDLAARFGGTQFAVLIPECGHTEALLIAERLRSEIASTRSNIEGKSKLITVTASLGYAQMQPDDTLESLLADAEVALARAQSKGGNCVSQ